MEVAEALVLVSGSPRYKYPKGNPSKLSDIGNLQGIFIKQQFSYDLNKLMRVLQVIWEV
jgi:hypothetical protein